MEHRCAILFGSYMYAATAKTKLSRHFVFCLTQEVVKYFVIFGHKLRPHLHSKWSVYST